MKDFSNYKKHIEIDMKSYSGKFHFNEQLKQEGTDIKINKQSSQMIDGLDTPIRAIVRNHGNEYNELKEERSVMIDKKYNYKVGDYIEYLGDIDKDNPFFNTTKMTKCNYILKWMDDGILYQQPCIIYNNTKYTGGTKVQNGFTEVDAMVNITIQMNDNTRKINYGKRLYTMKNAWQVTLIDNITTGNVFSWTLGKDSINTNDDIVNEICDAFLHNYAITLSSNSESIVETSTYQIVTNVTDNNVSVPNPIITYTSSDETIATVNLNGLVTALKIGNCTITASVGSVSTSLVLNVTAKTITPVISYGYKFSQGVSIKQYVTSILTCTETTDSVTTPLNISCSWDSVGQSLISTNKIVVTTKSSSSIGIKNALITSSIVAHLTVTDIDTGALILDNVAITFVNGL